MKWYNVELNEQDARKLRRYLVVNHMEFETSGVGGLVHFEIELDEYGCVTVDEFLSTL